MAFLSSVAAGRGCLGGHGRIAVRAGFLQAALVLFPELRLLRAQVVEVVPGEDAAVVPVGEGRLDRVVAHGLQRDDVDLAQAFARKVGSSGMVVHTDINAAMLRVGRNRLLDAGLVLPTLVCDAEKLPFARDSFDRVSVGFGLRNMTHKDKALAEMHRVLKPGGKLLVLEFSKVAQPLAKAYDWYSFNVLPLLGRWVARDESSYRYLAESIRMHPGQEELKGMMKMAGFGHVDYHNLTAGVAALHVGIKC